MDVSIGIEITLRVSLSKFGTANIELRRVKADGFVKRCFITPNVLRMMFEKSEEIDGIIKVMREGLEAGDGGSKVHIEINEKKALSVEVFGEDVWVAVETFKDGSLQHGLTFRFRTSQWKELVERRDDVMKAVCEVSGKQGETKWRLEEGERVQMYRSMIIKGSDVRKGPRWCYGREEAEIEVSEKLMPGDYVRMQTRLVARPEIARVRNAAQGALLLCVGNAEAEQMQMHSSKLCTGCVEASSDQEEHSCLLVDYQEAFEKAKAKTTAYQTVAVIHEMLEVMGLGRDLAQNVPGFTSAEESALKDWTVMHMAIGMSVDDEDEETRALQKLAKYVVKKNMSF